MRLSVFSGVAIAAMLAAGSLSAEILHFTAKLDGASETPGKSTAGKGSADVTLDTQSRMLDWKVSYSGLSGPATMAHFHGPAAPGVAAGVAVPLAAPLASPINGMATLTDGQIGDLRAGLWYINIHTAQNPGGEIRGQLLKAK